MSINDYFKPASISECLKLLKEYEGRARLVAGATDLFLDIEKGKKRAEVLVDVRNIPELREIQKNGSTLYIGAAVTHAELEKNDFVRKYFMALAMGASVVGGPQIRNIGTIGGNVLNAQPAADTAVPLFAFDADAVLEEMDGTEKVVPISSLYEGPGKTTLDCTRCLLKGFLLETGRYTTSYFLREAKRNALSLPMLNCACAASVKDGIISQISLVAGPVWIMPCHMKEAEQILIGEKPSPALFEKAGKLAGEKAEPRDSLLRGSGHFRKELLDVMVFRLLEKCCMIEE